MAGQTHRSAKEYQNPLRRISLSNSIYLHLLNTRGKVTGIKSMTQEPGSVPP